MFKYIDISTHQKNVEYESVKNDGIQGVLLRAGHTGYARKAMAKDELFETHFAGCKKAGIPVIGVYWFSRATTLTEAYNEAKLCLKFIEGKDIKFVYFDTEDNVYQNKTSRATLTKVTIEFLHTIEMAGYIGGVYASKNWMETRLDMKQLEGYEIWVAQYAKYCTYKGKFDMWQFTSSAKVKGMWGKIDMNWGYKPYHTLLEIPVEPSPRKRYIYLAKTVPSWRVYPLDKPARAGNEVGKLAPMKFGGLKYEILESLPNSVYVIKTATYGKVKIWAGKGTLHTIKEE